MQNIRKKKMFFCLVIFVAAIFILYNTQNVKAAATDNVSGWAWSENIGWISFNNTSGEGTTNYGVNIDTSTGILSGYAWSENIGWISFNRTDTGVPPAAPNYITYLAKFDVSSKEISGWARALNYGDGWDGWIKLKGSNYGVSINTGNGEFSGWAWSDMVIGWISFNCVDGGNCGTSDYKVITSFSFNQPPYIEDISQKIDYKTYCTAFKETGYIGFSWKYRDDDEDNQSRFDFRVSSVNNVDAPNQEVDRTFSGLNNPDGTVNSQIVKVVSSPEEDKITYGKTYYWWARVWDDQGNNSDWVQGPDFNTVSHAYPWIDFSRSPEKPSIDGVVQFTDQSEVYGGATKSSWLWNFPGSYSCVEPEIECESIRNPSIKFLAIPEAPSNKIYLTVTDSDGFSCTGEKEIIITLPLPEYKEVPPTTWLKNLFAEIVNFFDGFLKI